MNGYSQLIAAAPAGFALEVADVGSIGGLHSRWRPFRSIVAGALFDPREDDAASPKTPAPGADMIFRTALGAREETRPLYVTRRHTMTSMLKPDPDWMRRFWKKEAHTEIVEEMSIKLRPLDDAARDAALRPDVLKIDIQGAELEILTGAQNLLADSIFFVESEVSFLKRYQNQATFCDIAAFLDRFDFEFIDFHRIKRYRHINRTGFVNLSLGRGQRAGRLAFADGYFLLREDAARQRMARLDNKVQADFVLKAVMTLIAYGKADMAARWFDIFGDALGDAARNGVERALRDFRRRRLTIGYLHRALEYPGGKV
ncbi:MAG: FkbM family methyltransferase [Pseudomonadota bacterium]